MMPPKQFNSSPEAKLKQQEINKLLEKELKIMIEEIQ
jgi:hypothetical protein